jgi:hypothetical protein
MKILSYDDTWADLVAMARSNVSVLLVLAGVFLLLPNFAQALLAPPPKIETVDWNAVQTLNAYFQENILTLVMCQLPVWIGSAAIVLLLVEPGRLTVGQALSAAAALTLSIVILNWLLNLAVFGGFLLFFLPGIYLLGRLSLAAPVQMVERLRNPIAPLSRSMALTRGNGWRIAGLVLLVSIVATIFASALNAVFGVGLSLLLPESVGATVATLIRSVIGAASALLILLLNAALYRQLAS